MYVEWIGQIKDISELNEYEVAWEYLKKFMLGEGRLFHTQHDVDKASKKIEELIEKSKAKKPITIKPSGESVFDYPTYRIKCASCGHQLPMKKNCVSKRKTILYCDRCGQKIDWEE